MSGIYIHVPFCNQFCTYCNFYSVRGRGYREEYLKALYNEIVLKKDFFKEKGIVPDTVYFGGGTPSVFRADVLGEILENITRVFGFPPEEVTIEVNPNDVSLDYAKSLFSAGFSRVSMGVQSFVNEHLRWMNRRHNAQEAELAYKFLKEAGFNNISLDLIFGFEQLSMDLWEYNLKKIVELSPQHISSYQLSIEDGSALKSMYKKGNYTPLPDSLCNIQYSMLQQYLVSNGYEQYEISSFAKTPVERNKSKHNSGYWTKDPYLGLGPAAHSFDGDVRYWNNSSVVKYCKYYSAKGGFEGEACGKDVLSEEDKFNESVMLGLRTVNGVDISALDRKCYEKVSSVVSALVENGDLVKDGDKIRIPSNKLFVSDGIISKLFIV